MPARATRGLPLRYFQNVSVPPLSALTVRRTRIVVAEKPNHKRLGKIGAIRRELEGTACPFCGGHAYHLVLRANTPEGNGLFARCSKCQRPLALDTALSIETAHESHAL
jgi:hypothetical protein